MASTYKINFYYEDGSHALTFENMTRNDLRRSIVEDFDLDIALIEGLSDINAGEEKFVILSLEDGEVVSIQDERPEIKSQK